MINITHYDDIIYNILNYFLTVHNSFSKLIAENFVTFTSNSISAAAFAHYLKKLDEAFFHSSKRKLSYHVKQIRKRTLDTTFGTISFSRRIYQQKASHKFFYYKH